jgi:hypothetical protein
MVTNKRPVWVAIGIALMASNHGIGAVLTGAGPGRASGVSQTTQTIDSAGDTRSGAQDHTDVIRAELTRTNSELVFTMSMAGALPQPADVPSGWDLLGWLFVLDTNPDARPAGYPFPPNAGPAPPEFVVELRLYRPGFSDPIDPENASAILIDRTPLLEGRAARINPIKSEIEGSTIRFRIDPAAIGNPSKFEWTSGTLRARLADDKSGYQVEVFDRVPDKGMAPWPPK